jgi:hypothetical protein
MRRRDDASQDAGLLCNIDDAVRCMTVLMTRTTDEGYRQELELRCVVEFNVQIAGNALSRLGQVDPQISDRLSECPAKRRSWQVDHTSL